MANVIYGGVDAFDTIAYGQQDYGSQMFFKSQVEQVSNLLTDYAGQFFNNTKQLYDRYQGSEAIRAAKAVVRTLGGLFLQNKIQPLTTIGNLQQAPIVMQNWIMANPLVRENYHKQRCDGYSDTYVDMQPNAIGETHDAYREVMNGMVVEDENGNSRYSFYMPEEVEGVRPLSFEDQVDILTTWDIIDAFMKAGIEDPTSPFNNKL
jgi:hypothetical protein